MIRIHPTKEELAYSFKNTSKLDSKNISRIANLVNTSYKNSEVGFWNDNFIRTDEDDIQKLIINNEIAVCSHQDKVVACLKYNTVDSKTVGFGMLAVDISYRGLGIGKELIKLTELYAIKLGARHIQIEILDFELGNHPQKKFLRNWYSNQGYKFIRNINFKKKYAFLIGMSKEELRVELWSKELQ